MQTMSMSEDDAAYSLLLAQLLSDSAPSRNARVHSWIEHQYDFAFSEQSVPASSSRPPSPSPSSSLGAHRAHSIDRPDSPLLPRFSSERPSSPCPSYDALFFPPPSLAKSEDQDFEEKERLRALRFIVQEMAHWKCQAAHPSPHPHDKPLPAPPPSPASSLTQSTSSRIMRSRSSSTRISRLPSFTSTLSSDQSQPHEIPPPLPVSVIVHGEFQHELVLSHDRPLVDGYLHRRDDSLRSLCHSQEQDGQFLCTIPDDKDSVLPSPTLSNFSYAYSRESSLTTPYGSSPASPSSVVFSSSSCSPENITLPASPVDDQPFFRDPIMGSVHERTPSNQTSPGPETAFPLSPSLSSLAVSPPQTNVFPASPPHSFPVVNLPTDNAPHCLRAPKLAEHSQSRWSVATTASLTPSTVEPRPSALLDPRMLPKEKKDKGLKTPKKRTRFISLISRLSPGRSDASSTTVTSQTGDDVEYDSADSDVEDKEKNKRGKPLNKKSSLASLRASFSVSRASFSSQRPPMSFSIEEAPPLPTSPTLTSSMADSAVPLDAVSSIPTVSLSKIPARANASNTPLPPIPQSASTITSFQSSSQLSISDTSAVSASGSHVSLVCPSTTPNVSRISLLPAPGKRTSLASAAGIEPKVPTNPVTANQARSRSKSIFRLTAKPKSLKTPLTLGTKETAMPSRLPIAGNASLPSPTTARSRIPQAPTKFNPPAKLVTVIATQSRQAPALASPGSTSASRLPTSPSRPPPKAPRPITTSEKPPAENLPSLPASSKLPMPASTKGARVGTVRGFWKK